MEITEIRIKLMEESEDRLRAFCSITIDECFVIRDLKIIDGTNGPFVAMPSRKLAAHCHRCGHKNHLRAQYCNSCGAKLNLESTNLDSPQKLYADVAHPINSECREMIQAAVISEFEAELARSQQPGYRSRYDDEFDYESEAAVADGEPQPRERERPRSKAAASQTIAPKGSPPRPHFLDESRSERSAATPKPDSSGRPDDDFGAGIFE